MLIHAERQIRHNFLVNPATVGDAAELVLHQVEALASGDRLKAMDTWVQDGCAFGSLLHRNPEAGFVLTMFSDHPDHDDEAYLLDDSQALEWLDECQHSGRPRQSAPPTLDEAKAMSLSTIELASRWRCRRDTVDYMVEGGHLGAFHIGRFRRIRRAEVEKFERAHNMRGLLLHSIGETSDMNRTLNMIAVQLRAERKAARATA